LEVDAKENPVLVEDSIDGSLEHPVNEKINHFVKPFDLTQPPLLRVGMIKLEGAKHILMVDMHHIISDGISLNILINEFTALYRGEELPLLRIQYKDFSQWQNKRFKSKVLKKQESFWLNKFKGELPDLNMPLDYPRPLNKSWEGDNIFLEIEREVTAKIKKLNKETDTTLFMVLLAVYNVLLHKYTGEREIIVGTPVSGRRHADLENVLGVFINMLVLGNRLTPEKSFEAFLEEVKENALEANENQDYPFEELVKKLDLQGDNVRNPIFDVAIVLQPNTGTNNRSDNGHVGDNTHTLKVTPYQVENRVSRFDMLLGAVEIDEKISINLEYSTSLFKPSSVEKFLKHYREIMQQVVEQKEIKLKDIVISSHLQAAESKKRHIDFGF
jgi:NRPS condensation-like uncharacterized protein